MNESIFNTEQTILMNGLQTIAALSGLEIENAHGVIVVDIQGKEYIDFFAGVGVCSIGHTHPVFVSALVSQLQKSIVGSFSTKVRNQYLNLLRSVLPDSLSRIQFYSGGAEAVEAAVRLARSYTGRQKIVSFVDGYHGKTAQTMALSDSSFSKGYPSSPITSWRVPFANCKKCPLGKKYPSCNLACVEFLDAQLTLMDDVAAVIVEPIQGTAGNIIPPPEYLPAVAALARKHNILLIFDEMITGFGRTGRMFAMEHYGVSPDIVVCGKGIASGFPLSAIAARNEITQHGPFSELSASSSSYGGNPLACAAGLETLRIIIAENLVSNAAKVGSFMMDILRTMQLRHSSIREVRGKGLMIGVSLTLPDGQQLSRDLLEKLFRSCLDTGVLLMSYKEEIRIYPPLSINEDESSEGLSRFERALYQVGL